MEEVKDKLDGHESLKAEVVGYRVVETKFYCAECYDTKGSVPTFSRSTDPTIPHDEQSFERCAHCGKVLHLHKSGVSGTVCKKIVRSIPGSSKRGYTFTTFFIKPFPYK